MSAIDTWKIFIGFQMPEKNAAESLFRRVLTHSVQGNFDITLECPILFNLLINKEQTFSLMTVSIT